MKKISILKNVVELKYEKDRYIDILSKGWGVGNSRDIVKCVIDLVSWSLGR